MKKLKKGYMCGIAFLDELEHTDVNVYHNVKTLTKSHAHVARECGIMQVEIKFKRWIRKPTI